MIPQVIFGEVFGWENSHLALSFSSCFTDSNCSRFRSILCFMSEICWITFWFVSLLLFINHCTNSYHLLASLVHISVGFSGSLGFVWICFESVNILTYSPKGSVILFNHTLWSICHFPMFSFSITKTLFSQSLHIVLSAFCLLQPILNSFIYSLFIPQVHLWAAQLSTWNCVANFLNHLISSVSCTKI